MTTSTDVWQLYRKLDEQIERIKTLESRLKEIERKTNENKNS